MYNSRFSASTYNTSALLCLSLLVATPAYSYFNGVSLNRPSHSETDSAYDSYTHYHDNSSTIINHVEIRETDPLTLEWLFQKAKEGAIEELYIVRKNRGFYEQLLKKYIQNLHQQKVANYRFSSNRFVGCACLMAFFTFFTAKISYPIAQDILRDYQDIHAHPFALLPAVVALVGPTGLLGSSIGCIRSIIGYQDSIDSQIQEANNLLTRLQAM